MSFNKITGVAACGFALNCAGREREVLGFAAQSARYKAIIYIITNAQILLGLAARDLCCLECFAIVVAT